MLVQGASLVRTADITGSHATLTGDTSAAGPIDVWGPSNLRTIVWDGQTLSTGRGNGELNATLPGPPASIDLPSLSDGWRFNFESDERLPSFDDSHWPIADNQTTDNPIQPTSAPVLYAQDYGFEHGFVWYRGHFTATGNETAITITADTGPFGSFAVWLNGTLLGSASTPTSTHPFANMDDTPLSQTFTVPAGVLKAGQDNVISVLTENMGQDESFENSLGLDSNKTPRGLESASLSVSTGTAPAITWRLQGASAAQAERDPVRGPTNPAGLAGSNAGWALPGFPDSSWTRLNLPDSWASRGVPAGVGWYRTQFSLHIPSDVWAPIGLQLTPPGGGSPGPGAQNFQALDLPQRLADRPLHQRPRPPIAVLPAPGVATHRRPEHARDRRVEPRRRRRRARQRVAGPVRGAAGRDPRRARAEPGLLRSAASGSPTAVASIMSCALSVSSASGSSPSIPRRA